MLPRDLIISGVFPGLEAIDLVAFSRVSKKSNSMTQDLNFGIPSRTAEIQGEIIEVLNQRSKNRRKIQECIDKISPNLNQSQQINNIASCLFNGPKTQIATEQLLLSTLLHKNPLFNPFRGEKGPCTSKGFGFHLYPIGLAINHDPGQSYFDLIILNWDHDEIPDFFNKLFTLDGKPCYLVADLPTSDVFMNDCCMSQIGKRFYQKDNAPSIKSFKIKKIWNLLTQSNGLIRDFLIFRQNEGSRSPLEPV